MRTAFVCILFLVPAFAGCTSDPDDGFRSGGEWGDVELGIRCRAWMEAERPPQVGDSVRLFMELEAHHQYDWVKGILLESSGFTITSGEVRVDRGPDADGRIANNVTATWEEYDGLRGIFASWIGDSNTPHRCKHVYLEPTDCGASCDDEATVDD